MKKTIAYLSFLSIFVGLALCLALRSELEKQKKAYLNFQYDFRHFIDQSSDKLSLLSKLKVLQEQLLNNKGNEIKEILNNTLFNTDHFSALEVQSSQTLQIYKNTKNASGLPIKTTNLETTCQPLQVFQKISNKYGSFSYSRNKNCGKAFLRKSLRHNEEVIGHLTAHIDFDDTLSAIKIKHQLPEALETHLTKSPDSKKHCFSIEYSLQGFFLCLKTPLKDFLYKAQPKALDFVLLGSLISLLLILIFHLFLKKWEDAEEIAHDIRAPLSALKSASYHLDKNPSHAQKLTQMSAKRIEEIAHKQLHKHFFKFHKNHETKNLFNALKDLIAEKELLFQHQAPQLNLNFQCSEEKIFADIDPIRFKRVCSNLLENAADSFNQKQNQIEIFYEKTSKVHRFHFIDNGCGISQKDLKKITQKGFSSKSSGKGLGLYAAKKEAKNWGGSLSIQSTPQRGSTITLEVPQSPLN